MRDTHYVILGKQFPPLKNNNQLFFGVANDYVMCVAHIMNCSIFFAARVFVNVIYQRLE